MATLSNLTDAFVASREFGHVTLSRLAFWVHLQSLLQPAREPLQVRP